MLTTEILFNDFHGKIHAYIQRRVTEEHCEDLTSHTFCKATEAIVNEKGPRKSESGWLYRIAHNAVIDHYRWRDRRATDCLDDYPNVATLKDDPAQRAELIELKARLASALRCLTPAQQQVIQLRYIEGYSFAEIAEAMGITVGAAKALQHRGIVNLKEILSNG